MGNGNSRENQFPCGGHGSKDMQEGKTRAEEEQGKGTRRNLEKDAIFTESFSRFLSSTLLIDACSTPFLSTSLPFHPSSNYPMDR